MVDLPTYPRRLTLTETPKSSLTRGDLEAPYTSLANGLGEIGEGLGHLANEQAKDAGLQSVTIGEDGKPQVTKPVLFRRSDIEAFDRGQRFAAMTQADSEADTTLLQMRDKFKNDPAGFQAAADSFRQQHLSNWANSGPEMQASLDRQMRNRITGIYGGLLNDFEHNQTATALTALNTKSAVLGNDLETLARKDGIYQKDGNGNYVLDDSGKRTYTKQYEEGLQDYLTLLNEKTKNPTFKFPKELADAQFDELRTRLEGASIHGDMERIYDAQGPMAARQYLLQASKGLEGKVKQIDKIVSSGLQWIRTEDAGMRGARDAVSREWAAAKPRFGELAPDVVDELQRRAIETGNFNTAQEIAVTRRAHELAGSVPRDQVADILRSGQPIGGAGRANYMGGPLPQAGDFTQVTTPGGLKVTVNKQAAPAFEGFLRDLEAAGAPIRSVGGQNTRTIAGTNQWSQHAYGNAIDIDQSGRNQTSDALRQWATANKDKLSAIEAKWGMIGGQNFSNPDFGHWEWAGPGQASAPPVQPVEAGNINLNNRPRVRNPDGSISTVRSLGVNIDGKETLIPTVSDDGRILTDEQAIQQYEKTGKHLGKFNTPEDATKYAEWLHLQQEQQYARPQRNEMDMRAGLMARNILRQGLAKDANDMLAGMNTRITRGDYPAPDEISRLGGMIAAVGDEKQMRKAAEIAVMSDLGPRFAATPAPEREALISQRQSQMATNGSQFDSDLNQMLQQEHARVTQAYEKDPYGAFEKYERNNVQAQPLPSMDMGNVGDMTEIAKARLRQQNTIRATQERPPFSIFRPAEQESFKAAVASADGKQTQGLLGFLNQLPDEVLLATVGDKPVKEAIKGAAGSQDPIKYSAAMSFADKLFALGPETAKHVLGEDMMNDLKMWQQQNRYMNPDELAEQRRRESNDPQVKARHKELIEGAQSEARKMSFEDVLGKFNNSWWNTVGFGRVQAPVDTPTGANPLPPGAQDVRDAFMGDFEQLYSTFRGRGLDKDKAAEAATDKMKTVWTASPTNGGRLMTDAPEQIKDSNGRYIYPTVGGSYDWMTKQLEADIEKQVGKPIFGPARATAGNVARNVAAIAQLPVGGPAQTQQRNYSYQLISDRQTQSEAQQGLPASYQVMITDAQTGRTSILPLRQNFDVNREDRKQIDTGDKMREFERLRNEAARPPSPFGRPERLM